MNININKVKIDELKIAINCYVKGLNILINPENEKILDIQRMVEHALVSYDKNDIEKQCFLEPEVSEFDDCVEINLTNKYCNQKETDNSIKIRIPYSEKQEIGTNMYSYSLVGEKVDVLIENK